MKFWIQVTGEDINRMKAFERRGRSLGVLLDLKLLYTGLHLDWARLIIWVETFGLIYRAQSAFVPDEKYEKRLYMRLAKMVERVEKGEVFGNETFGVR